MLEPTKILILANVANDTDSVAGATACAALPVTSELLAHCHRRRAAAQAADACDRSLAYLSFRDPDGPPVYGGDLLEACTRSSKVFQDDFCNHQRALLPAEIHLEMFATTRVECRKTVIWPSHWIDQSEIKIAWTAVAVTAAAPIRTEPVTLDYLEQLLAAGEPPGCDCEAPGYFCSGVPGILAHLEQGRLVGGEIVERCDSCQRYPSDTAALAELRRLGLA